MMGDRYGGAGVKAARRVLLALIVLAVAASLLPLIETDRWWIRYLDFVRLQLAMALAVLLPLALAFGAWGRAVGLGVVILGAGTLGHQIDRLRPYTPTVKEMATVVAECPAGSRLRIMVANVLKTNREFEALFEIVGSVDPDVLLALETDEWWDETLEGLHPRFPHRVQHIPGDARFYGMHLFSRYPLLDPQVLFYYDTVTPTIRTGVALPDGGRARFLGLHPRPPHLWDQPTTMRDAHLVTAALEARESERPTVVAGDLNATPWANAVRLSMRIGGLLDPRVGRGLYPTYSARSWLMAWPLDHVLFQDEFALTAWKVLPAFGSDHYPVLAELCLRPDLAEAQSAPEMAEEDLAEAEAAIRAARSMEP